VVTSKSGGNIDKKLDAITNFARNYFQEEIDSYK